MSATAVLTPGSYAAIRRTSGLDAAPSGCSTARSDKSSGSAQKREFVVREAPVEVREGDVVADRYRIGQLLGSGAMGTVFAAHHVLLDQKVAIKFLVTESMAHSDSIARFVREARATATIKSPHVVRVLDVALRDGGGAYIVMEYLEGCDLASWLRTRGPPDVHVAVDFVLQACDAIAEAHQLRIIHRDLKPANLFAVQRGGSVEIIKVLDFGISKAAGLVSTTAPPGMWRPGAIITEERIPIGSPCYMSPEQMESARDVDLRTDIWSLGVTLFELITGTLPFQGQSLVQVYATIKSGPKLSLPEGSPRGLIDVIRNCLAPDRSQRYASVDEMQAALAPFSSPRDTVRSGRAGRSERGSEMATIESRPRVAPSLRAVEANRTPDATLLSADPVVPTSKRDPRVTMALGLSAVLAMGGLLGFVSTRRTSDPPSPPIGSPLPMGGSTNLHVPVGTAPVQDSAMDNPVSDPGAALGPKPPSDVSRATLPGPDSSRATPRPPHAPAGGSTTPSNAVTVARTEGVRPAGSGIAAVPQRDGTSLPAAEPEPAMSSREPWSPPDVPK
jgi:eukaryotic-like serine/threonine-protein kinase